MITLWRSHLHCKRIRKDKLAKFLILVNVYLWPRMKLKDSALYVVRDNLVSPTTETSMCSGKLLDGSPSSSREDVADQQMQVTPMTLYQIVSEYNVRD